MQCLYECDDFLILEDRPVKTAILIGAVTFGLAICACLALSYGEHFVFGTLMSGGLVTYILMRHVVTRTVLMFNRPEGFVTIRQTDFTGTTTTTHMLEHFGHALAEPANAANPDAQRLTLVLNGGMDAGAHPLSNVFTNGNGPVTAARCINRWLAQQVDSAARAS